MSSGFGLSGNMFSILSQGGDTLNAFQQDLERINLNAANFQTTAFKSIIKQSTTNISGGIDISFSLDFSQGAIVSGGPLNAAIIGEGLFMIDEAKNQLSNNKLYTRSGEFKVTETSPKQFFLTDTSDRIVYGYRVNSDRTQLSQTPERIDLSNNSDIGIDTDGTVVQGYKARQLAIQQGLTENLPQLTPLYKLALTTFQNNSGLKIREGNAYQPTNNSGRVTMTEMANIDNKKLGTVRGQSIEASNVVISDLNVESIILQRNFTAVLNNNISSVSKLFNSTLQSLF